MSENDHLSQSVRTWFRPPRAHGEVLDQRVVSFLELFYDLVFVVLIAQLSHTLAGHITWDGIRDFVVLFVLIWFGWLNGTLYHELHGGEDGRSRTYIFIQMTILACLAVYTAHAGDTPGDGQGFAIVYTILLAALVWQWFDVRRHDTPEMRPLATRYLIGLGGLVLLSLATVFVDHDVRRTLWLAAVAVILLGSMVQSANTDSVTERALRVTESMSERFGLFTILVLGEVVVGVVDGVGDSERSAVHLVTAFLALGIGFGFWWNYFDFIGRREPRSGSIQRTTWIYGHLALAIGIATTGAGMVTLIEHGSDSRTPTNVAWLVAGGSAAVMIAIAVLGTTMPAHPGRRRIVPLLVAAALIALVLGATQPTPWQLALVLNVTLFGVWVDAFVLHSRHGEPIATT